MDNGVMLIFWIVVILILYWVIKYGVRAGAGGGNLGAPKAPYKSQWEQPVQPAPDGPGKFFVVGVDRATKMDTTWHVDADSEAAARVKADLEGIVVTDVRRVGNRTA